MSNATHTHQETGQVTQKRVLQKERLPPLEDKDVRAFLSFVCRESSELGSSDKIQHNINKKGGGRGQKRLSPCVFRDKIGWYMSPVHAEQKHAFLPMANALQSSCLSPFGLITRHLYIVLIVPFWLMRDKRELSILGNITSRHELNSTPTDWMEKAQNKEHVLSSSFLSWYTPAVTR